MEILLSPLAIPFGTGWAVSYKKSDTELEKKIKNDLKGRDLEISRRKGLPKWQVTAMSLSSRPRREGWVKITKDKELILTDKGIEVIKKQES